MSQSKNRRPVILTAGIASILLLAHSASGASVTWDPSPGTVGAGNNSVSGGAGVWNNVLGNWTTDGGLTNFAWSNVANAADIALFGTAGGAVTVGTAGVPGGTINLGGMQFSVAGYTIGNAAGNGTLAFGAQLGSISTASLAAGDVTIVNSNLTGTGGLTIAANGDLSATGGGSAGLFRLAGNNTGLTGGIAITSGLVTATTASGFGGNTITLTNGGGILDPNASLTLSNNIIVGTGGGTVRLYGSSTTTLSGAITGSTSLNRTDGGTLILSGNLLGYSGSYNNNAGTTAFTTNSGPTGAVIVNGGTVAVGNNGASGSLAGASSITVANNANLFVRRSDTVSATAILPSTINLSAAVSTFEYNPTVATGVLNFDRDLGSDLALGRFRVSGGTLNLVNGTDIVVNELNIGAQSATNRGVLQIGAGATLTARFFNIGANGSNSGTINQTGGTVTVQSGGTGFRLGHWNNNALAGNVYNLSGGTLDATPISVNSGSSRMVNIGWDGQGDMIVGGGPGTATLKAFGIVLDANGDTTAANNSGTTGNMTLTISNNGVVEVGTGAIAASSVSDRILLNGGTLRATGSTTWGAVMNANPSTTSTVDTNGSTVTLTNPITGNGTIALPGAGGLTLSTGTNTWTFNASLTGTTNITKTGAGSLTLAGAGGSYAGTIASSAGTLIVSSPYSSATVTTANGTTFGGEPSLAGFSLGTTTGATLNVSGATPGALAVSGNVTVSAGSLINLTSVPVTAGPFTVLSYGGTLSGAGNFTLIGASNYRQAVFANPTGLITLDVGGNDLVWNGTTNATWDAQTSSSWGALEDKTFFWADRVSFTDAGVALNVGLVGDLRPGSIVVNSVVNNYTFSGDGGGNIIAGGGSLTKDGGSTLSIASNQAYTGGTTINNGVVELTGGGGGSGVIRGTVTINPLGTLRLSVGDATGYNATDDRLAVINISGGTLDVNVAGNQTLGNATINMTGGAISGAGGSNLDFFQGSSALNTLASPTTSTISGVTLSPLRQGSTTFTVADGPAEVDLDIFSAIVNSPSGNAAGAVLIKAGPGTMALSGANTFTGGIVINAGTVRANSDGALGGTVPTLNGGTLSLQRGVTINIDGGMKITGNNSLVTTHAGAGDSAIFRGFDVNSADLIVNAGVTGAVLDSTVKIATYVYGFRVDTAAGSDVTFQGPITGGGSADAAVRAGTMVGTDSTALWKLGTGKLTLTGVSDFNAGARPAVTSVQEGTLALSGGDDRLPTSSAIYMGSTANTNGKLILDGISQTVTGLQSIGTSTASSVVGGSATPSTLGVNNANNYVFTGKIGGTGANENNLAIRKDGSGVLTLSSANTYTGGTTVNAGTLLVTGSLATTGAVQINSGGILAGAGNGTTTGIVGIVGVASGAILQPGVAANTGSIGTLFARGLNFSGEARFDLAGGNFTAGGAANDLVSIVGSATLDGGTLSPTIGGLASAGVYTLISTTAGISLGGGGLPAINPASTSTTRLSFTPAIVGNDLKLTVAGAALALTWSGANSTWDLNSTVAWTSGAAPQTFYQADTVAFTDAGIGQSFVNVSTNVSPGAITVNNSLGNDYTFQGFGLIEGLGTLTKTGLGTLTLENGNNFSGKTTISGGKVILGSGGTLAGSGSGLIEVTNGAQLVLNDGGVLVGTEPLNLNAGGTLTFDRTDNFTFARAYTGVGGVIRKEGFNTVTMNPTTNPMPNTLIVNNGTVTILGGSFGGNLFEGAGQIIVNEGGTLNIPAGNFHALGGSNAGMSETMTLNGGVFSVNQEQYLQVFNTNGGIVSGSNEIRSAAGAIWTVGGTTASLISTRVNLVTALNLNVGEVTGDSLPDITISGVVGNTGTFTKSGPGTLALTGVNTYTGATIVTGGTVTVADNSALGAASSGVTLSNQATLQASGLLDTNRTITLGTGGGQIDSNGNDVVLNLSSVVTGSTLTKVGNGTLSIYGTQTYATLVTSGGTTTVNTPVGTGASTVFANANTNFTVSQTLAALNIGDGATVVLGTSLAPAPALEFAMSESAVAAAAVPEPTSLGLLLVSALGMLARRRRA